MKLDTVRDSLEETSISKMDVNVNSLTYSLMIDGIYTNKLGSVIREVSTNARDSLLSANKDSFLITIFIDPSTGDIKLSFKDEGLGLSEEDSLTYLCNLNASTKRDSNDFVGCFGIGSKSPFSLTDSYSFNCIKDGIKTNLNLFRIEKETPRFNHSTEVTSEVDSVECLITLGTSYPLVQILSQIYKELSLFDKQPDIKFITPKDTHTILAKDFFPEVIEFENHYRVFEPNVPEETLNYLETVGVICSDQLFRDIDISYRESKSVACGVVSYKYGPLHISYPRYRRQYYDSDYKLPYFSILKFGLAEKLSFDVSRENIDTSADSEELIFQKVLSLYEDLDLNCVNEFLEVLKTLTTRYSPRGGTDVSVFNTEDNAFEKTNKILGKIKKSLDYFKTKPDFLNLFFGLKLQYCFLFETKYRNKSKHLDSLLNLKSNLDTSCTLELFYFIEKVLCDDTYFYEDSHNKGTKPVLGPNILFNAINSIGSICRNIFSNFETENIKRDFYTKGTVTDLSKLKIDFVYTNSRLKSEKGLRNLQKFDSYPKIKVENTFTILVNSSKKIIEENKLISNLEAVRLLTGVKTYSLKTYEEVNPEFPLAVKLAFKSHKESKDSPPREFSESNIKLRNSITVVETGFKVYCPLRVLSESGVYVQPPITYKLVTQTEETTSVKLSRKILTQLPQFSENNSKTQYFGPRRSFVILVSKDLVSNQEEKDAIIFTENFSECRAYFEFENPNYQDIKAVFDSLSLSSFVKGRDAYPRIVYLELNKDYFDGSLLEDYRTFQGLCISRYNNLENYLAALESIEVSENFSEYLDTMGTIPLFHSYAPSNLKDVSDKALKLHKFLTSLGSAVKFESLPQFRYTHILYILNGNEKFEAPKALDKSFSETSVNTSIFRVQVYLDTLGRFLENNLDNLFYKMIDKEYLEGVEEEFKGSTININTEEITNLLKRF